MVLLPEDITMTIQQYTTNSTGVSNERLYDEIKLLDPSFNLYEFYSRLYRWKQSYDLVSNDKLMSLYEALQNTNGYSIIINSTGHLIIYTAEPNRLLPILNTIEPNGTYTVGRDFTGDNYVSINAYRHIEWYNTLLRIDTIMLSHPLVCPFYIGHSNYQHLPTYEYMHYNLHKESNTSYEYSDRIFKAIRELDPSINMTTLYHHTVDRMKREKNSNRYRSLLGTLINDIDHLTCEDDQSVTIFWKGEEHTDVDPILYDILPITDGWKHDADEGYRHSVYTGSDYMKVMQDIVLIDRINGYYPDPVSNGYKAILSRT